MINRKGREEPPLFHAWYDTAKRADPPRDKEMERFRFAGSHIIPSSAKEETG